MSNFLNTVFNRIKFHDWCFNELWKSIKSSGFSDYLRSVLGIFQRLSERAMNLIKEKIQQKLPGLRERMNQIRRDHGSLKVCDVTVDQLYNGLRGVMIHINDVSYLDPEKGIRIRGFSLPDLIARLPKLQGSEFPLAGGLFFLLLTGEIPDDEEALAVEKEWSLNAAVPDHVQNIIKAFPTDSKPMVIFSAAILAMQHESVLASEETKRIPSEKNWEPYLDDGINLIAKLPGIAASIYKHSQNEEGDFSTETWQDWNSSFAHLIGKYKRFRFRGLLQVVLYAACRRGRG